MKRNTAALLVGAGLLVGLVLSLEPRPTSRPRPWRRPPARIRNVLERAAERAGIPLELLIGVAYVESRYNPEATSRAGAMGLMQLMPETAAGLGVTDPYDAQQSAEAGARFLARLRSRFGNWSRALAAYQWGPGHVARFPRSSSWPSSTRRYVDRVLQIRAEA
jgi:soluble lytic murein transglycosylase-like protein